MKERIRFIALTVVILLDTCFGLGNLFPQPIRALSVNDGNVDGRDFLIWQRTIGITPSQMARVTVANVVVAQTRRYAGSRPDGKWVVFFWSSQRTTTKTKSQICGSFLHT